MLSARVVDSREPGRGISKSEWSRKFPLRVTMLA